MDDDKQESFDKSFDERDIKEGLKLFLEIVELWLRLQKQRDSRECKE